MTRSSKKLPKDTNKLAAEVVRLSTSENAPESIKEYLARIGRKGGLKGGKARAKRLSREQRSEIASKAAKARWSTAD
jgi:hypothetical protein